MCLRVTFFPNLSSLFVRSIAHTFGHLRIEGLILDPSPAANDEEHDERVKEHSSYTRCLGCVVK